MDEDSLDSSSLPEAGRLLQDRLLQDRLLQDEVELSAASSSPDPDSRRLLERKLREVHRLRSSASYRIGRLLTHTLERPWRLLLLPVALPRLAAQIWSERRNGTATDVPGLENLGAGKRPQGATPRRRSIVLFPTNGVGFGHFTRMYSVARRLQREDPELEIVFFTMMPCLHVIYREGWPTYHLAGRYKHAEMSGSTWNEMLEEMLRLVLENHRPKWFMFDGAFPYRGMLNAIREQRGMKRIWMRRGMFREGAGIPADSIGHFDLVIHPGDALPETPGMSHGVKVLRVPPIVLFEPSEMFERPVARRRLGLPAAGRVVYVQLGAGRINDIESEVRTVVDELLADPGVTVVLGESLLGQPLDTDLDRVVLLRDYPNARFFKAFDACVQAGGYNSFHEMRTMQLPTLFLPNMHTGLDDQVARCRVAEEEGWGIVNTDRSAQAIRESVRALLKKEPLTEPLPAAEIRAFDWIEA